MATRRVDLGTVGFNLEANIKALQDSVRVLKDFGKQVDEVTQKVASHGKEINRLADTFRALDRAAIIAVGPLSGVGARMAVLAALFREGEAGTALFIAGTAGVVTILGLLAAASVRATMEQEKLNALLLSETGSAPLVGDAYKYVQDQAERLGLNVKGLTESYAKFGTSARLVGLDVDQQNKIFIAASTAAAALRLNTERTNLVFLALEQMLSKGVVSMEELRRQLGDLIPGAFELAATAMGKTTAQMNVLVRSGQLLSVDLLPKLADQLMLVFGPSSVQAADSTQAAINRFSNSVFELSKAFDQAAGFSQAFRAILSSVTHGFEDLSKNMDTVIALFGALAGAGVGLAVYGLLLKLPAAITAVTASLAVLRTVGIGAALVALVASGGSLIPVLAALGLAAGGAALGYVLLKKETDNVMASGDDFLVKTRMWIDQQEKLTQSDWRAAGETKKAVGSRIEDLKNEIEAIDLRIAAQQNLDMQMKESAEQASRGGDEFAMANLVVGSNDMAALEVRRKKLTEMVDAIQKEMDRLNALKVGPRPVSGDPELSRRELTAMQAMIDSRKALSPLTELEIMLNKVNTGTYKDFRESVKDFLTVRADEITTRENTIQRITIESAAMIAFNASADKGAESIAALKIEQDKLTRDMEFATSIIGKTTLEQEKLSKAYQVDLLIKKAIKDIDGEVFPAQIAAAMAVGEAIKKYWIPTIEAAWTKTREATTGMKQAIVEYSEAVSNSAKQTKDFMTSTFKAMEDALVQFVRTGKLDFRSLADFIITELIRIEIQRSIMGPLVGTSKDPGVLSLGLGAAVGFITGSSPTGRAGGGRFWAGDTMMVGEQGPEIITAATGGQVVPNSKIGGTTNHFYVDMTGADSAAVARLEKLVMQVNGSIERRSVAAVADYKRRSPAFGMS